MAKKKKTTTAARRVQQRRPAVRPSQTAHRDPEDEALFRQFRQALRSEDPLELLALVSGFLEVTGARGIDQFVEDVDKPSLSDLVDSFIATSYAETTSALMAMRALTPDQHLAARMDAELVDRRHPMPPWLHGLELAQVDPDVWLLSHVLGDGDDYVFGVTLPSGHALSAVVYIDHNMGTVVKDAFVIPETLDYLIESMRQLTDDPDQSLSRTDPAAARAAVEAAIEEGSHVFPPLESESSPMCRPLVEWMLRMLPADGSAPRRPDWTADERLALQDKFFASSYGAPLDDPDHRGLVQALVSFGADYSSGDPLRWSPVAVEVLLMDWFPRKVIADTAYLSKVPDLLRAWVRYSHQKQIIRDDLTRQTLQTIDEYQGSYQRAIRSEQPHGPAGTQAATLAQILTGPGGWDGVGAPGMGPLVLHSLDSAVGGREALLTLDTAPLPDEEFAWAGICDDIHPAVRQILNTCDECAAGLLDVEHRTAMRRFLARAAAGDPEIFRRKASPARAAAAIAWVICRASESAGSAPGLAVKELLAWFGVKGSVSQRAQPFLHAIGATDGGAYAMDLGTPDLLTATRRTAIVAERDRWLDE